MNAFFSLGENNIPDELGGSLFGNNIADKGITVIGKELFEIAIVDAQASAVKSGNAEEEQALAEMLKDVDASYEAYKIALAEKSSQNFPASSVEWDKFYENYQKNNDIDEIIDNLNDALDKPTNDFLDNTGLSDPSTPQGKWMLWWSDLLCSNVDFFDGYFEYVKESGGIGNINNVFYGDLFDSFCENHAYGRSIIKNWFNTTMNKIKTDVNSASKTVIYDPLILDLDGDGFNIETKENGANFDLDKNGFAEKINWTTKDGFLCLDLNGNGNIDDGGEVFGDQTLLADGTKAKNGFEALAQYDSNNDGVIDANDEIFGSLRVWIDSDGSGTSGEGELKTLAELGVKSINLNYENLVEETGTEATIGNSATFTYEDGTINNIGELWVSSDLFDTTETLDIEIPDEIKALANVGSIGNVHSLHYAMALDETGELKALVEGFAAEQDYSKRIEITEKILYFICDANDVADGSRGAYMDAKQLAVIEAMLGEKYVGTSGANPHVNAAPILKEAYADLLNMYYSELIAQTHIKDYLPLLRYTENEDGTKTLNADLFNAVLSYQFKNGDENAKSILADAARYVKYLDNGGINGIEEFAKYYMMISGELAVEVVNVMSNGYVADGENPLKGTNGVDYLAGLNSDDKIYGESGDDTLIGGKGNDRLEGGYGSDTYIFNKGDGQDIIKDYAYYKSDSPNDKIVFGEGITAEDIVISRNGNNLIIAYGEGDSVTVQNYYSSGAYEIECFETSDGYSMSNTQVDLMIQSMASFEADTGMSWTEAVEQGNETANSIISEIWVKTVS